MPLFTSPEQQYAAYREAFSGAVGQKVLEDLLSKLFFLPGADPAWRTYNDGPGIESLRSFATFLLGGGGLGILNETSNEEFVRKMLEVSTR